MRALVALCLSLTACYTAATPTSSTPKSAPADTDNTALGVGLVVGTVAIFGAILAASALGDDEDATEPCEEPWGYWQPDSGDSAPRCR